MRASVYLALVVAVSAGCGDAGEIRDAAVDRDARLPDAGRDTAIDAAVADGAPVDAPLPDAAAPDAAAPDAAMPDAAIPDASAPDALAIDATPPRECSVPGTYATIQAAVDDPSCYLIHVAAGTYTENVVVARDVMIHGPAPGATAVIDGGGIGDVVTLGPGARLELRNLTVQNGGPDAAGIRVAGELWLRDSAIVFNAAYGIQTSDWASEVYVLGSTIADNGDTGVQCVAAGLLQFAASDIARNQGSGIYCGNGGRIVIADGSAIRDNLSLGLHVHTGEVVLTDSDVAGNGSTGVSLSLSHGQIVRATVANNGGLGVSFYGGGGATVPATLLLSTTTVSGNAHSGVGVSYSHASDGSMLRTRIEQSLIAGNALVDGAGIVVSFTASWEPPIIEVVNTTVTGNRRGINVAKGWDAGETSVHLRNVTITENDDPAGDDAAGLRVFGSTPPEGPHVVDTQVVHVHNSVIAGNTTAGLPSDCATLDHAEVATNAYNVWGETEACAFSGPAGDLIDTDPLLGPLADNGGPTLTHELLDGSPAIDGGDPSGCRNADGSLSLVDQRGEPRPVGLWCDSGAYEANP